MIVGIFLLLFAGFYLFIQYRDRQRRAEELDTAYNNLQNAQQQLVHSEKMATLGELAAGIAHEIKNPLNFMTNFSEVSDELLVDLMEESTPAIRDAILTDVRANLNKIKEHGRRADSIVRGMMRHSQSRTSEVVISDINALVEEAITITISSARASHPTTEVSILKDLGTNIPAVAIIPQDISRVIINILNNAMYALRTRYEQVSQQDPESQKFDGIVHVCTLHKEQLVEIRIRDNGPGIPEDSRNKIFQPFYTTKPTGEGTGLGLSISYDIIVKGHGGELFVEPRSSGAEFVIRLPIAARS
jgi:signal transduction histidine kinase